MGRRLTWAAAPDGRERYPGGRALIELATDDSILWEDARFAVMAPTHPRLHVHIYGRQRTGRIWRQPVDLPEAPGAFQFSPLTPGERADLAAALAAALA